MYTHTCLPTCVHVCVYIPCTCTYFLPLPAEVVQEQKHPSRYSGFSSERTNLCLLQKHPSGDDLTFTLIPRISLFNTILHKKELGLLIEMAGFWSGTG